MAGIEKTIATFSELSALSVDLIGVVKAGGFKLSSLPKLLDSLTQINNLIKDAPGALPELTDLDGAEAAQVGAAAFSLVKSVLGAISA